MPFNHKILRLILSKSNAMELHDKIKFIRLSQNLTQVYLADELEIDVANYSRLERGETNITTERLDKIANILGVETTAFFENTEEDINKESLNLLEDILKELKDINKKLNT